MEANDALFDRVRDLFMEGKIKEARAMLYPVLEDPLAWRILDKMTQQYPIPEDELLASARKLIADKKYDSAHKLLSQIPEHPIARKTLEKLNARRHVVLVEEPSPPVTMPEPELAFPDEDDAPPSSEPDIFEQIVQSWMFRPLVTGGVILMAMLYIAAFFGAPWVSASVDAAALNTQHPEAGVFGHRVDGSATAFEIFMGSRDGEEYTLNLDALARRESGFSHVRFIDRTLILIPLFSVVLMGLAWQFYNSTPRTGVILTGVMFGIILFLGAYPLIWQNSSESAWQENITSVREDEFTPEDRGIQERTLIAIRDPAAAADYLQDLQAALEDSYAMQYMAVLSALSGLFVLGAGALQGAVTYAKPPA